MRDVYQFIKAKNVTESTKSVAAARLSAAISKTSFPCDSPLKAINAKKIRSIAGNKSQTKRNIWLKCCNILVIPK